MEHCIYIASDGSMLSLDDVISMLKFYLSIGRYQHLSFDEITGGETEFVSQEQYEIAKSFFEKIKK